MQLQERKRRNKPMQNSLSNGPLEVRPSFNGYSIVLTGVQYSMQCHAMLLFGVVLYRARNWEKKDCHIIRLEMVFEYSLYSRTPTSGHLP